MGWPYQEFYSFLRGQLRRTRSPLTVVPCAAALGAVLLVGLATVFRPAGAGASRNAEPAMVGPDSSRHSPAAAVQGVEIRFDEVVASGEIPPLEREYAAELDSAGHSFGAYLTTRLLEEHPDLYDGGIRHAGANSMFQALRAFTIWLRHWDEDPVDSVKYDIGAELPNGFRYRLGQERGTEDRWASAVPGWRNLLSAMIPAFDPSYDPDGDGSLSPSEIEAWTSEDRPDEVRARLAETAVTGRLDRKLIVFSGLNDVFSPPSIDRAYRRLVEETVGPGRVMLYLKPGAGHGHGFPVNLDADGNPVGFWPDALRALDQWVEKGEEPGMIAGLTPK